MITTPGTDEAAILRAVQGLEDKLTALINSGLASLSSTISTLQTQHANTLLDQTKVNATFADRERVEVLARRVDATQAEIAAMGQRLAETQAERRELREQCQMLADLVNNRTISIWSSATGYAVSGAFLLLGSILTFTLTHLLK